MKHLGIYKLSLEHMCIGLTINASMVHLVILPQFKQEAFSVDFCPAYCCQSISSIDYVCHFSLLYTFPRRTASANFPDSEISP